VVVHDFHAGSEDPASYTVVGLYARTGYDLGAAYAPLELDAGGIFHVRIPELGRVELRIPGVVSGALLVNGEARELPVGVGIDRERGIVTWVAGPGYLGTYRLSFAVRSARCGVRGAEPGVRRAQRPGRRGGVAPAAAIAEPVRMHVDRVDQDGASVTLHGWAFDPQASSGAGIGAVHIWARRLDLPAQTSILRGRGGP